MLLDILEDVTCVATLILVAFAVVTWLAIIA